jgi:hypothetical protein
LSTGPVDPIAGSFNKEPMAVEFSEMVVTVTAADGAFLRHQFPGAF